MTAIDHVKLLQGRYEIERTPGGIPYGRKEPDSACNVLAEEGLHRSPVVDETFLGKGREKPLWPGGKTFAVCLTHDVDVLFSQSLRHKLRRRMLYASRGRSVPQRLHHTAGAAWDVALSPFSAGKTDPLHRFEKILALEQSVGAHSTWFFWPGRAAVAVPHASDCVYEMDDRILFDGTRCSVAELMLEFVRRGNEIGLHASWHAATDGTAISRERDALRQALGQDVISVRQHFLHFDFAKTPAVQAAAGFRYDSSVGFNDDAGFRCGTCYPWSLIDVEHGGCLSLTEVPLIVQDGGLLREELGLGLDIEKALKLSRELAEAVQEVGGVFTVSWHPHTILEPSWWRTYKGLVRMLAKMDPWFCTLSEVGSWWSRSGSDSSV